MTNLDIAFLDHPETSEAGRRILESLNREGDRGAMLVAGEMLSAFLGDALRALNAGTLSKKELKDLFAGSGPLSSFSARIRISALSGLISANTFHSLERLRALRNKAAHSEGAFSLQSLSGDLQKALELGPNFPNGSLGLARESVLIDFIASLQDRGVELQAEHGVNPFARPKDILDILHGRPHVMEALEEKAWRYQLAIGVWSLLGLLRIERDQHLAKLGLPFSGSELTARQPSA